MVIDLSIIVFWTFQIKFPAKYDDNIYYLMPFYPRIFANLTKLIVIDADVRFEADPAELFGEFRNFSAENVIGVSNDLAPHYYQSLKSGG